MDPVKTTSQAVIRYDQIAQFIESKEPICVNPNNGSMLDPSNSTIKIEKLYPASIILNMAADLLEGKKITLENKEYKKIAKKMVKYYTKIDEGLPDRKLSPEEKKILAINFRNLSGSQMFPGMRQAANDLERKLRNFAKTWGVTTSKEVSENFAKGGVPSDAADLVRHLNAGIVDIVDNGVNLYGSMGMSNEDLSGVEDEAVKLKISTERIELVLSLFASKATANLPQSDPSLLAFKAEIRSLLDEMRSQANLDLARTCFEQRLDNLWKHSKEPALVAICQLIHILNQTYTSTVGKVTTYFTKDLKRDDCPYRLLNLDHFELKDVAKKIDIEFSGNQVKARHLCQFDQVVPLTVTPVSDGLKVDQIVEISSSLDSLDKWEFKQANLIHLPQNKSTENATKINQFWKVCGIATQMIMYEPPPPEPKSST